MSTPEPSGIRPPIPVAAPSWADLTRPAFVCLLLGLAPFFPEPHLLGKVRWVAGGAVGMAPMDWLDLVWHAWPWFWLVATALRVVRSKR